MMTSGMTKQMLLEDGPEVLSAEVFQKYGKQMALYGHSSAEAREKGAQELLDNNGKFLDEGVSLY